MKICFACTREVYDADRFCGHCGADQAVAIAGQAAPSEPEEAAPAPDENTGRRRGLIVLLVLVGLTALAVSTWLIFGGSGGSRSVRVAFDGMLGGSDSATGPVTEPSEDPTTAPSEEPTEAPDEEEAQENALTSATAPTGAIQLQPGRWQFTTQLVGVSKVNPNDDFEISRQGIGSSESHSLCVTPAAAENPRAIAFPFQQGLGCSPSSFDMSNGSYSSRLTCSFPQFGGRRPVTASGQYSRINASVSVGVTVPAQVVEGDFDEPPEILMQYRIQGYLTGPC